MKKYNDRERPKDQCYDCGLKYDDPAWLEAVVPHEVWELINPTYHVGAGLLCITCMARRCVEAGLSSVELKLTAGVFEPIPYSDNWTD